MNSERKVNLKIKVARNCRLVLGLMILISGTGLFYSPVVSAAELPISSIPLMTKRPNVPPSKVAGAGERLGLWVGGGIFNGERAYKEAMKLFEKYPSLATYYPTPRDREEFAASARREFSDQVGAVDNIRDAIYGIEVLTHHMDSTIMNQVLKSKGIDSPTRRQAWSLSLKKQIHACVSQSTSFFKGALPCSDIFAEALPANIGLAAMHEITRQKLASLVKDPAALFSKIDAEYRACAKNKNLDLDAIEPCARRGMKTAVTESVMEPLTRIIAPEFKNQKRLRAATDGIKSSLSKCVETALVVRQTDEAGIRSCIDTIVVEAGTRTIRERITYEPAVIETYPKSTDRVALSKTQETAFSQCIQEQKKQNKRDELGVLITDPCRYLVTNSVTYSVVIKKFTEAANEALVAQKISDPEEKAAISKTRAAAVSEAKATLDQCWNPYQNPNAKEACLRAGVNRIATAIASRALDQQIEERIHKAKPELKNTVLRTFNNCLQGVIHGNVSEDPALTKKINQCVGPLRRSASLEVAEFEIRDNLHGEVSDSVVDELVSKLVKKDFAKCLGPNPDESTGARCIQTLRREASKEIGSVRLPIEIRKLLPKANNPEEEKLFIEKAAIASQSITAEFRACIDKNVRLNTAESADLRVDLCTKKSIQQIALFVANLQVDSKVAGLYGDNVKGLEDLKKVLNKELSACMNKKKELELDEYIKQINICGELTSERAILYIARDQLQRVLHEIERSELLREGPVPESEFRNLKTCPTGNESMVELTRKVEELKVSMTDILSGYIHYDLVTAKKDIVNLLAKVNQELANNSASRDTRQRVLSWLSKDTSVVTQVLKAVVRDRVQDAFGSMPEKDRPSSDTMAQVTNNATLNRIFETPAGQKIVSKLINELLDPVIIGNEGLQSPKMKAVMDQLDSEIKDMLVAAPEFSATLAKGFIQPELNKLSFGERFCVRTVQFFKGSFRTAFSKDAFNWEKIRLTPKGVQAERYMLDNLVGPSIKGQTLSDKEKAERKAEEARLVRKAVLSKR